MGNIDFTNHPLSNGNRLNTSNKQLPIDAVDKLADLLVSEFSNPEYRKWYCGVIYEFGTAKVQEWLARSNEGSTPGKLFSKYVKDARTYRSLGEQ